MGLGLAIILPFGLVFFASGLLINALQLVMLVVVWPFSPRWYRIINHFFIVLLWGQVVFVADWWGGMKVNLFVEAETYEKMGREAAILMCNHRSDVDWLVGWVQANRAGCLGGAKAIMKKSILLLPVFGWSMWFMEYIFLARKWARDQSTLEHAFTQLSSFPMPFWLCIFVEGTRFTKSKLLEAQELARSKGLPVPQHTLVPRTKGFVTAVKHMRGQMDALYDITFAPVGRPTSMASLFEGRGGQFHVRVIRHELKDLPQDEEGIADWCRQTFVAKDKMLEEHERNGTFGEELYVRQGPPLNSLLITLFWFLLVGGLAVRTLLAALASGHLTALSVGIFGGVLVVLTVIMMVFLRYSQAEPAPVIGRNHQD